MYTFEFCIPTRLIFGPGALNRLEEVMKPLPQSVLVVVGKHHVQSNGTLSRILQMLDQQGKRVSVYGGVKPNPTEEFVIEGARAAKAHSAAVVLGIGGGSVLDSARGIALAATHEGDLWDYRVAGRKSVGAITDAALPVVTIPTTAGSGTEISPAALLCRGHLKEVFYSPFLFPRAAIVDPELTLSLPKTLSMQMAVDAFVQGLEAFVSTRAHEFSDMFALTAMRLVIENATRVLSRADDLEARAHISLAGVASLFAISQAGVGAIHALSNPLSGRFDFHHGYALSILLGPVMEANMKFAPEKYGRVAQLFGVKTEHMSQEKAASEAVDKACRFIRELRLGPQRVTLEDFNASLPFLVQEAHNPDMATNPAALDDSTVESIYRRALL